MAKIQSQTQNNAVNDLNFLEALQEQMNIVHKTMEMFAPSKRNGETPNGNGKLSVKLTKQEIKRMPENIKKDFIANNFIVNYRITSNGYYEARMRRKNIYI